MCDDADQVAFDELEGDTREMYAVEPNEACQLYMGEIDLCEVSPTGANMGGEWGATDWSQVGGRHPELRWRAVHLGQIGRQRVSGKGRQEEILLAATPPLGTLTSLLALSFREGLKVMGGEFKKVHLDGVVRPEDGDQYIQAPEERRKLGKGWKLKKWFCRMRQAARAWEEN